MGQAREKADRHPAEHEQDRIRDTKERRHAQERYPDREEGEQLDGVVGGEGHLVPISRGAHPTASPRSPAAEEHLPSTRGR